MAAFADGLHAKIQSFVLGSPDGCCADPSAVHRIKQAQSFGQGGRKLDGTCARLIVVSKSPVKKPLSCTTAGHAFQK
ncbi:MAG: hypothetical protein CMM01_04075 [Rhodopirellula sp.]|nr:hypothetical protein [Rhodopirellula sp.]